MNKTRIVSPEILGAEQSADSIAGGAGREGIANFAGGIDLCDAEALSMDRDAISPLRLIFDYLAYKK